MDRKKVLSCSLILALVSFFFPAAVSRQARGLASSDFYRMRSVEDVQFSPDGTRIACVAINHNGPGSPYPQIWIMNLAEGKFVRLAGEKDASADPQHPRRAARTAGSHAEFQESGLRRARLGHADGEFSRVYR